MTVTELRTISAALKVFSNWTLTLIRDNATEVAELANSELIMRRVTGEQYWWLKQRGDQNPSTD
jgi:hypothetical protein